MGFRIRDRIDVTPAFIAFLCAYYYFDPAQSFAPFLLSVLLHEAGHLLALKLSGAKILMLRLSACGATIVTEPLCYQTELLAAAAGPATNLLLLLIAIHRTPVFALVNLCLLTYNLLPIFPLDGGRMLRALLLLLLPARAAELLERVVGGICLGALLAAACYLTCVWHAGLWPVLVAALLLLRVTETILLENKKMLV